MPRFERDAPGRGPLIQGFSGHGFRIDGALYESVLLTPTEATAWPAPALDDLSVDHLAVVLAMNPAAEFLILGTGARMAFPPRDLVRAIEALGLGIEAMDSRAAARTWGMLRGEDRWIAAALMPL